MASPRLYGHEDQEEHNKDVGNSEPLVGYYCADCFKEFIYRYDIEQRIWLKTHWYLANLDSDEQEYTNHCLQKDK